MRNSSTVIGEAGKSLRRISDMPRSKQKSTYDYCTHREHNHGIRDQRRGLSMSN
jgi:hypothetical protein